MKRLLIIRTWVRRKVQAAKCCPAEFDPRTAGCLVAITSTTVDCFTQ